MNLHLRSGAVPKRNFSVISVTLSEAESPCLPTANYKRELLTVHMCFLFHVGITYAISSSGKFRYINVLAELIVTSNVYRYS